MTSFLVSSSHETRKYLVQGGGAIVESVVNKTMYPGQKENNTDDGSLGLAALGSRRVFATTVAALYEELYHIPHNKQLREHRS